MARAVSELKQHPFDNQHIRQRRATYPGSILVIQHALFRLVSQAEVSTRLVIKCDLFKCADPMSTSAARAGWFNTIWTKAWLRHLVETFIHANKHVIICIYVRIEVLVGLRLCLFDRAHGVAESPIISFHFSRSVGDFGWEMYNIPKRNEHLARFGL